MAKRLPTYLASGLIALGIGVDPALAASTCADLGAELSRLRAASGAISANKAANYQQEWIEQSSALERERSRARQANCFGRGFLFFRSRPQPVCRQILPRLRKLQANVARLGSLRREDPGGGPDRNRIAQLRAIMLQNGCFDDFQMRTFRNRSQFEAFFNGEFDLETEPGYTFRTLCVRACDGYYFPISFSTTRDQFAADQQTCEALCPGGSVELYYHDDPASASENMISLYGEPYEDHPAAFSYRSKYDKSCSCGGNLSQPIRIAGELRLSGGDGPMAPGNPESPGGTGHMPVPTAKPGLGEDPETLINRAGDFRAGAITSLAGASRTTMRNGRPVRIVGPVHWSAQAKEEGLLIPVPN
ncbi:MAG: DUF2865 domain-containing protein [Hyphomicrobiales bacterium]|nr:DUF2865 domain-containing protein [Hyphomicrobiales bacterium]